MGKQKLQEKINDFLNTYDLEKDNIYNVSKEFFEWLQGTEYPGSIVEYNGKSNKGGSWYTLQHDGNETDFIIPFRG